MYCACLTHPLHMGKNNMYTDQIVECTVNHIYCSVCMDRVQHHNMYPLYRVLSSSHHIQCMCGQCIPSITRCCCSCSRAVSGRPPVGLAADSWLSVLLSHCRNSSSSPWKPSAWGTRDKEGKRKAGTREEVMSCALMAVLRRRSIICPVVSAQLGFSTVFKPLLNCEITYLLVQCDNLICTRWELIIQKYNYREGEEEMDRNGVIPSFR